MPESVKSADCNVVDIGTRHQMLSEAGVLLRRRVLLEKDADISDESYRSELLAITAQELLWAKRWGVS